VVKESMILYSVYFNICPDGDKTKRRFFIVDHDEYSKREWNKTSIPDLIENICGNDIYLFEHIEMSIFLMALIGLLVAMLVGMFIQSTVFDTLVSGAGVLIFSGLVAYDHQKIRDNYYSGSTQRNDAIWSAIDLYLDFLNLFLFLLRFIGVSNDD